MPQLDKLSDCPRCAEPLEPGDLFCGVCGGALPPGARHGLDTPPSSEPWAPPARAAHPPDSALPGSAVEAPSPSRGQAPEGGNGAVAASPTVGTGVPGTIADSPPDPRTAVPSSPGDTPPVGPGGSCVACGTGTVAADGHCGHCGHAPPRERDHIEAELEGVAAASDRGLRHPRNEDYFSLSATALPDGSPATVTVVCDGVSSATRPDEASATAAEAAGEALLEALSRGTQPRQAMHDALISAGQAVNALATERGAGTQLNHPACTIVSAVVAGDVLTVGWVGDSRAYWVPEDSAAPSARLTEDDSWAAQMTAAGLMTEAEAYADPRAHAITGWLGADAEEVVPHTASYVLDQPGVVVVCTDGLWNYAESAPQMAAALPLDARSRPLRTARHLVGYALDSGGQDNVTVAVLPFPGRSGPSSAR